MTVNPSIDPARMLEEQLALASPDLLRDLLGTFIGTLLSADADSVCGAAYGTSSDERVNSRNGYRHRDFDTRAGTLDIAIPKLRAGTYFPEWLLERRTRAEQALTSVVATCYLLGVSTRRMNKLVQSLGVTTGRGRALYLQRRRRPGPQGPRGRARGARARPRGDRDQR